MAIYCYENININREIKPSRIPQPSPNSRKYLYAKYIAYTVYVLNSLAYLPAKDNGTIMQEDMDHVRFRILALATAVRVIVRHQEILHL